MFEYSFDKIFFNEKIILNPNRISANSGEITVVTGESGSGKTTLFNSLIFQARWELNYKINGVDLVQMLKENRNEYIYSYISSMDQQLLMLDDLTVKDHINMLRDLTHSKINYLRYIDILELDGILDKFPQQLSGGERVRTCFLLSLIKDTCIYILDEPTASLDEHYTKQIIKIIQELLLNNKTVIVLTHDQSIVDIANKHYHIYKNELLLQKKSIENRKPILVDKVTDRDIKQIPHFFNIMKNHQKRYQFFSSLIIIILVGVIAYGFSFNNLAYAKQQQQINKISSNELLVFKASEHAKHEMTTDYTMGHEIPLSLEEIEQVKNIKNVESCEWRYDSLEPNYQFNEDLMNVPFQPQRSSSDYSISILENNSLIDSINLDETSVSTYLDDKKVEKSIDVDFGKKGVYISQSLANQICEKINVSKEKLKGKVIGIDLSVPLYNTSGRFQGVTEDDEQIFINSTTITHEKIEIPIAGILKWSSFGVTNDYANSLYIERTIYEEIINKHKQNNPRKLYVVGVDYDKVFLNECPENYKSELSRVFDDQPWQPTALSVFLNSIENINSVIIELEKLGYSVKSDYIDSEKILIGMTSMQLAIQQATIILSIIVCLACVILNYSNQKNELSMKKYFTKIGLSQDNLKMIYKKRYIYNCKWNGLYSILVMFIITIYVNVTTTMGSTVELRSYLIIILMITLIYYIVPTYFNRVRKDDKT